MCPMCPGAASPRMQTVISGGVIAQGSGDERNRSRLAERRFAFPVRMHDKVAR